MDDMISWERLDRNVGPAFVPYRPSGKHPLYHGTAPKSFNCCNIEHSSAIRVFRSQLRSSCALTSGELQLA